MSATSPADIALQLPETLDFSARPEVGQLNQLPGRGVIALLLDAADQPVQLLSSQNLRRWALARLTPPEGGSSRADLGAIVRRVRWHVVYSTFEADWRYWRLARMLHPREYRRMISFGPAWFLNVDWAGRVPELRVSERIFAAEGEFLGPWPSQRLAQQSLECLWDLFDLCRYPEQVRRTPLGVACAYHDMGRCDAPCSGAAALEGYVGRVRSAWAFASGGGGEWLVEAEQRMRAAAAATQFEVAGLIKRQQLAARQWLEEWSPRIRRERALRAFLLLPAPRRRAWTPFLFDRGALLAGPLLADRRVATAGQAWLAEALAQPRTPAANSDLMELTWLFARLLQRGARDTTLVEWLVMDQLEELPARIEAHLSASRKRDPGRVGDASGVALDTPDAQGGADDAL